jgi:hypothetical protein
MAPINVTRRSALKAGTVVAGTVVAGAAVACAPGEAPDSGLAVGDVAAGNAPDTVLDLTKAPYNADPTGVEDIGPIVDQALDRTQGTSWLYLPTGTYNWATSVSSGYPTYLRGDGVGRTVISHDPRSLMLHVVGVIDTSYSLSSDIGAGDDRLDVSDATGISAGDVLNVRSLKIWPGSESGTGSGKEARYGELVEVAYVSGNTLFLTELMAYHYAVSDTVSINQIRMVDGVALRDFTVANPRPNTGTVDIINLRHCRNVSVENLRFKYQDGPAISGVTVWGLHSDNVSFFNGSDQSQLGRLAYGFSMSDASRDWTINAPKMFGGRHTFTTTSYGASGTCFGIPRGAVVVGGIARGCYEAAFDTHEEGDDITFVGCKVLSARAFPFQIRAPRTKLVGCSSSGMQVGPIVRKSATNFEIQDYTAYDVRTGSAGIPAGVQLENDAPSGLIDGVEVIGSDAAAILISDRAAMQVIRNVTARDVNRASGNGAVEFLGTSNGHILQNIVSVGSAPAIYGPATVTDVIADNVHVSGGREKYAGGIQIIDDTVIQSNTQTGTTYTLAIGDASKSVEMNNAAANTLTVPPNSSVPFPVGTVIEVCQLGAGQTTIAADSGVSIKSPGSKLKLTEQFSSGSLRKRGTDEWVLTGDITT